jgi:hypothetical protein
MTKDSAFCDTPQGPSVWIGREVGCGSFSSILACPQHVRLGVNLGNADCPVLQVEGIGLDVIQTARGRTLRASDAEQHDRAMRSLSSGRAFARPSRYRQRLSHGRLISGTRSFLALRSRTNPPGEIFTLLQSPQKCMSCSKRWKPRDVHPRV